ncbi:MAG: sporulation integral membrane protein YlbJ, partial [Hungateiclostridium thermocellum]|nr:sporulation integral membrane protein YlbJ [Acetivibrio thermocellus]
MRKNKKISKIDAERSICFSSTSGPSFMLGAVSVGMLNNPSIAPLIIYPHYLGAITIGFILRFYKGKKNINPSRNRTINKTNPIKLILQKNFSIGTLLANSVKNSINTITIIGGFIIFYSVITELIFISNMFNRLINLLSSISPICIDHELIKGFIAGLLEITTGCKKIASANIGLINKIIIINFLIGWSGFSIH